MFEISVLFSFFFVSCRAELTQAARARHLADGVWSAAAAVLLAGSYVFREVDKDVIFKAKAHLAHD